MKLKPANIPSQILILALAGIILILMIQMAQAQRQDEPQTQVQVLNTEMPKKSLGRRLWENTTFTYYQQFLGATAGGEVGQTYNVFQEGIDAPGSGHAPAQSFHAVNVRHKINNNWTVGASLAASAGYTGDVTSTGPDGRSNTASSETEFFNARFYVTLPAWKLKYGTLFTTVAYEAPTSKVSKDDEMSYGYVITPSFAFNSHSPKWTYGLMGQYYRMVYANDVILRTGYFPRELQTVIVSGGPYATYRFNDKWMVGGLATFDWDQRGLQTGSREFNNNLSNRVRATATYFPAIKHVASVGVFAQALMDFDPDTTALGAEFALKF